MINVEISLKQNKTKQNRPWPTASLRICGEVPKAEFNVSES